LIDKNKSADKIDSVGRTLSRYAWNSEANQILKIPSMSFFNYRQNSSSKLQN